VIADVARPELIQSILARVARQQAPPEFIITGRSATQH
jgi:hypothetical protein